MSNFWTTSDGKDVTEDAEKEYSVGGGSFDIIPDKTNCLALVKNAAWTEDRDNNRYINVQWSIVKPEAFANQNVWQKLWVKDDDPRAAKPAQKRDKALKMLSTIDANAGGKLAKAGREPDDDDLALALTNKQMGITVMVWENDQKEPGGNWVSAVWGKGTKEISDAKKAVPRAASGGGGSQARRPVDDLDDDDIPF